MCDVTFVFFKPNTAYELRISYWSSDVCSSDLHLLRLAADAALNHARGGHAWPPLCRRSARVDAPRRDGRPDGAIPHPVGDDASARRARAPDTGRHREQPG